MPRHGRFCLAGVPVHVIQRGNNRCDCFFTVQDHAYYSQMLDEVAREEGVAVHAYVLMTNHVHLLVTPADAHGVSHLMKRLGQRYTQHVNRVHQRSGTLWEGRFKSSIVDAESYLVTCQRYIELNPVRAGMVRDPADYRWSSYRCNALGVADPIVTPHVLYQWLGEDPASRQRAYRDLFGADLQPAFIDRIRQDTNGGFVLGDEAFTRRVSLALMRRITRVRRVRVRNKDEQSA